MLQSLLFLNPLGSQTLRRVHLRVVWVHKISFYKNLWFSQKILNYIWDLTHRTTTVPLDKLSPLPSNDHSHASLRYAQANETIQGAHQWVEHSAGCWSMYQGYHHRDWGLEGPKFLALQVHRSQASRLSHAEGIKRHIPACVSLHKLLLSRLSVLFRNTLFKYSLKIYFF